MTIMAAALGQRSDFDRSTAADHNAVAVAIAVLWFALLSGFVPDMLHRAVDPAARPYVPVTHLHAALSVGWMVLLSWQALRVRVGDMAGHRALGAWFGWPVAVALTVTAVATIIYADRAAWALGQLKLPRTAFQFGHVIPFALLTGWALASTRHPGAHKRLLILGVASVTDTGLSRWLGPDIVLLMGDHPVAQLFARFLFAWALLLGMAVYDLATRGRLHPIWLPAAAIILGTEALSFALYLSPAWPPVAASLLGL